MKKLILTLGLCALFLGNTAMAEQLTPIKLTPYTPSPRENNRIISIVGTIDESLANYVVIQIKDMNMDSDDEIEISISSYGGSVYAGLKIIDAMKASRSPIRTVCEGYCMSMGALILSSGTKGHRVSMPNATILLHQVSAGAQGTLTELENNLQEIRRIQGVINGILKENTGLSEEKLTKVQDHDNYMSPVEAKKLKLIDGIITK